MRYGAMRPNGLDRPGLGVDLGWTETGTRRRVAGQWPSHGKARRQSLRGEAARPRGERYGTWPQVVPIMPLGGSPPPYMRPRLPVSASTTTTPMLMIGWSGTGSPRTCTR